MTFWTDEREVLLKELHSRGLSAALVANGIGHGCTKNSVIGKISRLKLPAPLKQEIPEVAAIIPLSLMRLKKHSCRWPLWDGDTPLLSQFFCSAYASGVEFGEPYCAAHAKKAYRHDGRGIAQ